jgi:putative acetyltransferase
MAAPPDSGDAARLIRALDDDLRGRYPGITLHGLRPEDVSIGLYRSAGYVDIPPFGEYVGNAVSVCFEKRLT